MTDQSNAKPSSPEAPAQDVVIVPPVANKELVAKYLLANPSFLIDNPDLLAQIQVQLQENGVVSLTQIQASQAREKIKLLKSQLEELVTNARLNEIIYKTYAELNLDLAKASCFTELEACLTKHLVGTLRLESARIVLLNDENSNQQPLSEIQQRSLFDKKLARQPFYFGRVGSIEKGALFPKAKAESVALVLLSESLPAQNTASNNAVAQSKPPTIGLLAIASKDPLHFQPEMDTVLVDYLRKNLNFHLSRLR
ncbi:MAG: hypothetical protein ACJAVV_000294 [Alphaproteobacteria bacterium]|jgi:uncharacterized protein YigA (DUF484 family)